MLILSDPRSLDPASLGNQAAITAVLGNALYGTLMTTDEAGEIRYQMAESFTTTDNGRTFTLKLRPGLVFSDGTPLNAE
ncbi:ABC transporter substrate-binding protein, partial [Parafrankia sp. Ea1.12]|uniref:ABC transporter substrate-binding protein n=1 Tax=Parafrankia sp. Ea1.12 TaxID=573499 RepID=UPI001F380526